MLSKEQTAPGKKPLRPKWSKAAGDHITLSAATTKHSSTYLQGLDLETAESIRLKPAEGKDPRLQSVKPSCCASREELPQLSGQVDLTTGRAEVGYDPKKRDVVLGFVRHSNDSQGREVLENKARVRTVHGQDRFRSNDETFSQGAIGLRCEAARAPKAVMGRMGTISRREGGDTTMDRVLPFYGVEKERDRLHQLQMLEHRSDDRRSSIHSAASGVGTLISRKRQKQKEFQKSFSRVLQKAGENRQSDDYQLFIRKKWLVMQAQALGLHLESLGEEVSLAEEAEDKEQQAESPKRETP